MASVNPYLSFNDKCEEAFNFYKSVFGGEFTTLGRFSDIPPGDHPTPPEEANKVMHVALPIGPSTVLMGSDTPAAMGTIHNGNNFYVAVAPESEAEATRIFNGLAAGGTVTMPMEKAFWGAYFGMLVDKFGIQWMVNYQYEQ